MTTTSVETLETLIRHGELAIQDVYNEMALLDGFGCAHNIAVDRAIAQYRSQLQQRIHTFNTSIERWKSEMESGASV